MVSHQQMTNFDGDRIGMYGKFTGWNSEDRWDVANLIFSDCVVRTTNPKVTDTYDPDWSSMSSDWKDHSMDTYSMAVPYDFRCGNVVVSAKTITYKGNTKNLQKFLEDIKGREDVSLDVDKCIITAAPGHMVQFDFFPHTNGVSISVVRDIRI